MVIRGIFIPVMLTSIESLPAVLAERLQSRRLELGWSRATLAARAAVAPETLRAFERTGQISLARLVRLAVALGVDDELERLFIAPPAPKSLDDVLAQGKRRQRGR